MSFASDLPQRQQRKPWLDRAGLIQAIGGLLISLIALFSSYDHISLATTTIPIQQQWGIVWITSSLALVLVDAQLATRSRLRAANETAEARDRADQDRIRTNQDRVRADQERNRAAEARQRQAEAAERQREGIALLRGAASLTARHQLDPSDANRSRLNAFLALLAEQARLDREEPGLG
jgi:hypothetical protein